MAYGVNQKDHQKRLIERFEEGDIEIGCCASCYVYHVHKAMPKAFCMGCFRMQPKEYREKINRISNDLRRPVINLTAKKKKKERREAIILEIRLNSRPAPELLKPIQEVVYERECLRCCKSFKTKSRYTRLCEDDRMMAGEQGMSEHIHYMVAGGFE